MNRAELAARLDALEAQVEQLRTLVDRLLQATPAAADEPWRRLGLSEGERRIVTVLFADVSGFTALSERLDTEAFQLVMRDTMSVLASCVTDEGGTVEKFIGDAVCALYGAPVAHPDEPERAARTAIAMHAALAGRAEARPDLPPLQLHIGINTGPVIAGAIADGSQFGVMGDTINTAARLMNLATAGETFVSAETARRLRRAFRLDDRGVHDLKGKSHPVSVAALLRELGPGERSEVQQLPVPLVGREAELSALRAVAARVEGGAGATVALVGEDGVAAARLAEALADELRDEGWRVLAVAGAAPGVEARLAADLASPSPQRPMLVVVHDVDAAGSAADALHAVARSTVDDPVLWLATASDVPAPFVGAADAAVVRLGPLDDTAMADLFDALFPGALTAEQRVRLAHLADGSTQYAMEIALTLVEDGVVAELGNGRWRAVGDVDAVELPGSIAELVEARIDALSTAARLTLLDAAVVGQRFSRRLLARVASVPGSVDASLAELQHEELVAPQPDDMWAFRSRLVREVAYGCILRRNRPAAHRAVAEALLALEPERVRENAELLAHHFEASDEPALAVAHLLQSIDRAEAASDLHGSVERGRRLLRLRDRFPGRVDDRDAAAVLQHAGVDKLVLGDRSGLDDLAAAVELLPSTGASLAARAELDERIGWCLATLGLPGAAATHLDRAEALGADPAGLGASRALLRAATTGEVAVDALPLDAGDRFVEARAQLARGAIRMWSGDADGAIDDLRAGLDVARAGSSAAIADRWARWLIAALVDAGQVEEAEERARPILARGAARGDPTAACSIRTALALARRAAGDADGAAALAGEAERIAGAAHVAPEAVAELEVLLGRLAADEGDAVAADRHFDAAVAAQGDDAWLAWRTQATVGERRGEAGNMPGR